MNGSELYSPISNLLIFEEDEQHNMVVKAVQGQPNRFSNEFRTLAKLGEGSFGEAFKVLSNRDGNIYAIKKTK